MKATIEAFTTLVDQIIHQDLDDIQQQQFAIEGQEIITSLFETDTIPEHVNDLVFDFGFTPSIFELQAAGISFLDVICSCFRIFVANEYSVTNTEQERLRSWKSLLENQNTHPTLVALLCEKYNNQIEELS